MPALSAYTPGLSAALRHFWTWWWGELVAMVPARARLIGSRRLSRTDIVLARGETRIERVREGVGERLVDPRPLEALDEEAWGQLAALVDEDAVRLILTPPDAHALEVTLPRKIGRRASQAIALQLSELAPLPPDQLRWGIMASRSENKDTERMLRITVVMARIARIDALLATFAAQGLPTPDIWGDAGAGPVLLEAAARRRWALTRSPWLIACVLLLSIPVSTTILASIMAWSNEHAAAADAPDAARIIHAEARARRDEALRQAIVPLAEDLPASTILDTLATRLPSDASLVEAERDARGVRLVIAATDTDAVRDIMARDPVFRFVEADETSGADGRFRLTFTGRRR